MNFKSILITFMMLISTTFPATAPAESEALCPPQPSLTLMEKVLCGIEKRYLSSGFSARFVQTSTIKIMDISDTAAGRIHVQPPGKMRWEYESPDPQLIISDGHHLWVYRPEDNQVMQGESPSFFGDGKGAGFLSDMSQVRDKFDVFLEKAEDPSLYLLKLIPQTNTLELSLIYLFIKKENFTTVRIITYNAYGDETRMDFSNIQFNPDIDEGLFTFVVPDGTDIFQIDQ